MNIIKSINSKFRGCLAGLIAIVIPMILYYIYEKQTQIVQLKNLRGKTVALICALETYRATNGKYPVSLDIISKEFSDWTLDLYNGEVVLTNNVALFSGPYRIQYGNSERQGEFYLDREAWLPVDK